MNFKEPINLGELDAAQRLELARNPELFVAKRRIAELEQSQGAEVFLTLTGEISKLRAQLASQQQAEPEAEAARPYLDCLRDSVGVIYGDRAATASEDGGEVPQYFRQPLGIDEKARDRLTLIAREAAISSTHRYSYMPTTPEDSQNWQPHAWVLEAMRRVELEHSRIVAVKDAEIAELDALRNRLSDLLTQSIIAIRGPEPELTRWGYADLPLRVKAVVEELEAKDAEIARLNALINTPHTDEWFDGVRLEAAHQIERWGTEHDAGKQPADWFWLLGYLGQKAMTAAMTGDVEKARHHTISSGAMLLNWFRSIVGDSGAMRPGTDAPQGESSNG